MKITIVGDFFEKVFIFSRCTQPIVGTRLKKAVIIISETRLEKGVKNDGSEPAR